MRSMLALHCMLASGGAWRGVQAALPDAAMICPDQPGHGRAPEWDGGAFMDQALALALDAAPEGAFDLIGHSYGGCVALRLLADHPGRVRSLTLVEPVMFAAADPDLCATQRDGMASFRTNLDAGDRDAAAQAFTDDWGDGTGWDAVPERQRVYIRDRIHLIEASGPGIMDDIHRVLDRLPRNAPPVSIVVQHDAPDIVTGIANGLCARMPQATITKIGAGHMIPMANAAALADHLRMVWD